MAQTYYHNPELRRIGDNFSRALLGSASDDRAIAGARYDNARANQQELLTESAIAASQNPALAKQLADVLYPGNSLSPEAASAQAKNLLLRGNFQQTGEGIAAISGAANRNRATDIALQQPEFNEQGVITNPRDETQLRSALSILTGKLPDQNTAATEGFAREGLTRTANVAERGQDKTLEGVLAGVKSDTEVGKYRADKEFDAKKAEVAGEIQWRNYASDKVLEGEKLAADALVEFQNYRTDAEKQAAEYAANKIYEGHVYKTNSDYQLGIESAKLLLEGSKYGSDQERAAKEAAARSVLEGVKFSARQKLAGDQYGYDKRLEGVIKQAESALSGTKYSADKKLVGDLDQNKKSLEGVLAGVKGDIEVGKDRNQKQLEGKLDENKVKEKVGLDSNLKELRAALDKNLKYLEGKTDENSKKLTAALTGQLKELEGVIDRNSKDLQASNYASDKKLEGDLDKNKKNLEGVLAGDQTDKEIGQMRYGVGGQGDRDSIREMSAQINEDLLRYGPGGQGDRDTKSGVKKKAPMRIKKADIQNYVSIWQTSVSAVPNWEKIPEMVRRKMRVDGLRAYDQELIAGQGIDPMAAFDRAAGGMMDPPVIMDQNMLDVTAPNDFAVPANIFKELQADLMANPQLMADGAPGVVKELVKLGFDEAQANIIITEAAKR